MDDTFYRSLTHFARTLVTPGYKRGRLLLLVLVCLTIFTLPAMAEEPCATLGVRTVNWKSPDSSQTGVLVLEVRSACVAAGLGVRPGELITGFNGKPVANQYDLEKLAGNHAAEQAFSLTLKDATGQTRTLKRDALPAQTVDEAAYKVPAEVSGEWLSWFTWAGLFLVLSLTVTPFMWWILMNRKTDIAIGGAAGGVYEEFKNGGRKYVEAGIQGALVSLLGVLAISLIGPAGFVYNLYQPLAAMLSNADQKVCCIEDEGKYAVSPDGRWLAMVKPTPDRYFGLGDKIARTPYVAALADLQSGQFVAWKNGINDRWLGIEPSGDSGLSGVYFDTADLRPYVGWTNGFGTPIEPIDQPILADQRGTARKPELLYSMTSDAGDTFVFSETSSGKSFTLDPRQAYDKWWLSADGRVLALATRPYQPNEKYDGWVTRMYHTLRNFVLDDWTVTFWDMGGQRKLATYKGYGYDEAHWEDGRFLEASLDGRRWIMVRDNGFAFSFDLTAKMMPAYAVGRVAGPLYLAQNDQTEIAFFREPGTPSPENLEMLARQVDRYPSEILEANPQIDKALRATLGQSYAPLMEMLSVETPAKATPDGGLTYVLCKAHACGDGRLVVYISPNLNVSALLFHDGKEIGLPETPAEGEADPDNWSRWVLYEETAYPPKMAWFLYQAALADPRGMENTLIDETRGRISSRFWIVGKLP
jgi:hypothetical protein